MELKNFQRVVPALGTIQLGLQSWTAYDKSRTISQRVLFPKKSAGLAGLVRDPHSSVPDSDDPC